MEITAGQLWPGLFTMAAIACTVYGIVGAPEVRVRPVFGAALLFLEFAVVALIL